MLLAGADALGEGAKAANKDCLRVKRRSREVSAELGDIADEVKSKAGAAKIWRSLGMPGGDKVDLSDSALREAFNKIDIDGSGGLDQEELAIVRALPRPTHAGLAARTHAARGGTRCYFSPVVLFLLFRSLTMLGSLSSLVCAQAIKVANPDASEDTIKMLLSHADEDGDGNIDFDEYCKIMRHVED